MDPQSLDSIVKNRHATRSFTNQPVSRSLVFEILDVARFAPSNSNTQPWKVYVVAGEFKLQLGKAIFNAHMSHPDKHNAEYLHFPVPLFGGYRDCQEEFAYLYYRALNIDRQDKSSRHLQTGKNYLFFDAPIGMIFTLDKGLERGSWLDYGCFLQTIMLVAKSRGLDSCPQISFSKYHSIIRRHLPLSDNEMVICGMSLGYADNARKENNLSMPRKPVNSFTRFFESENLLKNENLKMEIQHE